MRGDAGLFWFDSGKISESGYNLYGSYVYDRVLPLFSPERRLGTYLFFDGDYLSSSTLVWPGRDPDENALVEAVSHMGGRAYVVAVFAYQETDFAAVHATLKDSGAFGYMGMLARSDVALDDFLRLREQLSLVIALRIDGARLRRIDFTFLSDAPLAGMGFQPETVGGSALAVAEEETATPPAQPPPRIAPPPRVIEPPAPVTALPPRVTKPPLARPTPRAKRAAGAAAALCVLAGLWLLLCRPAGAPSEIPGLAFDEEEMTRDPLHLTVTATMRFGETEVAWPFQAVDLALIAPDGSERRWNVTTDEAGRISFDLPELWKEAGLESGQAVFEARTIWDGKAVKSARYDLGSADIDTRVDRMIAGAAQREPSDAAAILRRALAWRAGDPTLWSSLAEASTSAGDPYAAIFAWREVLQSRGEGAPGDEERRAIRKRVVELTRHIDARPPPTADAIALLQQADEKAAEMEYDRAYYLAVAAEDAAPWWPPAYEKAGAFGVARHVQQQKSGKQDVPKVDGWDLEQAGALGSETAGGLLASTEEQDERLTAVQNAAAELDEAVRDVQRRYRGGN